MHNLHYPLLLCLRRMPSCMVGDKNSFVDDNEIHSSGTEGSLRNHLTIWGPGVPSGAVTNTSLSLTDILPTVVELAGAGNGTQLQHLPWSGISFANLLTSNSTPTAQQQDRFLFTFVTSGALAQCPQGDELMNVLLPDLTPERWVLPDRVGTASLL